MESRVFEGQAYAGYAPQQQAAAYWYPPQQHGYWYSPPRQGGHWYRSQQQGGYGYPSQGVVQPQQVNNFGVGLQQPGWELVGDNITSDVGGFAASELGIGAGYGEDGSDVYPSQQQVHMYSPPRQGGYGYLPQGVVQPQQVNNFRAGLQQGLQAEWPELFGDDMTSDVGERVAAFVDGNADNYN